MLQTADTIAYLALELAEGLESAGLREAGAALARAAATADRPGIQAMLLGRFSVGKSTLLNAFLHYPVLPGGLAPTTGVVCRMSYGTPGATVRFNDGRIETFSGPEALQPYVAMNPALPGAIMQSIVSVEVTLPLPLLESGLEIVDSPGLDEAGARTDRTEAGLERADIVLFVIAADQSMSETERRFLARQVLPRGVGALALVINFWDRIDPADQSVVLERLQEIVSELFPDAPPPLFPVSGGHALRARWRPRPGQSKEWGLEALEHWLSDRAQEAPSVASRAYHGRMLYAARSAGSALEGERARLQQSAREVEEALTAARVALRRVEDAASRTSRLAENVEKGLLESLAVQIASGEGASKALINERLQKNPYDNLASVRQSLAIWWPKSLAVVAAEAYEAARVIGAGLAEAGIKSPAGLLAPLEFNIKPPAPRLMIVEDTSASVKETLSGLFGSVSQGAADSVSDWMKKASRKVTAIDPRTRSAARESSRALEQALSIAAYGARENVRQWAARLRSAVTGVEIDPEGRLEAQRQRQVRRARELSDGLALVDRLTQQLNVLTRELQEGSRPVSPQWRSGAGP